LTNLHQKFKPVGKDRLFYDQYRYCMQAQMVEASALRKLTHANIDYVISLRKALLSSQHSTGTAFRSEWAKNAILRISAGVEQNLHTVCDVLVATDKLQFRHVVSGDRLRVYTNDVALFDRLLLACPVLNNRGFTEAVVDRPKDTVQLKNPHHKYRSYFTRTKLTVTEKKMIANFLSNYQGSIRLSPCLRDWATQSFRYTEPYYFVDHDDTAWLVMLSLVRPGLIKKTFNITKA
jgi:hypothetical protein